MYEIYYNDKLICLMHHAWDVYISEKKGVTLVIPYAGKPSLLLSIMDKMEKNRELSRVYVLAHDVKQLKRDFFSLFEIVEAAGGLVINRKGETLLLYRRGHWDLPKGKIEPNEGKKAAAIREVTEETGVKDVKIIGKLTTTYHIYGKSRGKRFLKPVYWYSMYTSSDFVRPETSEGIEKVIWVKGIDKNLYGFTPIFKNINEVIRQYFIKIKTLS